MVDLCIQFYWGWIICRYHGLVGSFFRLHINANSLLLAPPTVAASKNLLPSCYFCWQAFVGNGVAIAIAFDQWWPCNPGMFEGKRKVTELSRIHHQYHRNLHSQDLEGFPSGDNLVAKPEVARIHLLLNRFCQLLIGC